MSQVSFNLPDVGEELSEEFKEAYLTAVFNRAMRDFAEEKDKILTEEQQSDWRWARLHQIIGEAEEICEALGVNRIWTPRYSVADDALPPEGKPVLVGGPGGQRVTTRKYIRFDDKYWWDLPPLEKVTPHNPDNKG